MFICACTIINVSHCYDCTIVHLCLSVLPRVATLFMTALHLCIRPTHTYCTCMKSSSHECQSWASACNFGADYHSKSSIKQHFILFPCHFVAHNSITRNVIVGLNWGIWFLTLVLCKDKECHQLLLCGLVKAICQGPPFTINSWFCTLTCHAH